MKILIAEDEPAIRLAVRRVVEHSADAVIEAENGLEALALVRSEDPDLLITDLQMPLFDGFEVISALRSSQSYRRMPVICLSVLNTRQDIERLGALRISDYLLKPLRPLELTDRLRRVIRTQGNWRHETARLMATGDTPRMLLIDPDPNFRAFARPLLESDFIVTEAASAAEGIVEFRKAEVKPNVVLIADGLELLNESRAAAILSQIALDEGGDPPVILLLSESEAVVPEKGSRFDGIVRRTFIPDAFSKAIRALAPGAEPPAERLRSTLRRGTNVWLVSAARQTLGVLSRQDLQPGVRSTGHPTVELCGTIDINMPDAGCKVRTVIGCSSEHGRRLSSAVLRRAVSNMDEAADVLGEFVNTIGGRVKENLVDRGFGMRLGLPSIEQAETPIDPSSWDVSAWLRTTDHEDFFVGVKLIDDGTPIERAAPLAVTADAPPEPEAVLATAGAPADSSDDLDGILF